MKHVTRTQTGVRIESRLLKVLKALATELEMSLGDLIEGIVLHAFEGKVPFSTRTLKQIEALRSVYGLDLTAADSHKLRESPMHVVVAELARFARGERDPADFPHREHVRMGFEMLRRHSFPETALHFSQAIRTMADRCGKPEAYHETMTVAFLSLIAERMGQTKAFETFASANPDLFDKHVLERWYRPERLRSECARRTFILPEPRA
jgi:hypothetical protein